MRDAILTERGPKPIGPYSQAVRTNGFLYVSGQVALDPKTGEMTGADLRQQTERTLENLKGILEAAGSNLHHVVKTTVFLKDMNDFSAMNEVYAKYFTSAPPARSTVQVSRLPKDALVEIEAIAGCKRRAKKSGLKNRSICRSGSTGRFPHRTHGRSALRESESRSGPSSEMIEFVTLCAQAYFDVPKALPIGQLCEHHAQELIQAPEGLHLELSPIAGDATAEGGQRKMLHQLRKHQLASVHR